MRSALAAIAVAALGRGCACGPCPHGAELTGLAPPQGTEQWCQRRSADDDWIKHGPYTKWYANGQKAVEGAYADGKPDGRWREWYPSGQAKAEGTYAGGRQVGRWIRWDADGHKAGEVDFDEAPPARPVDAGPPDAARPPAKDDDWDGDWVGNTRDNCPNDANPGQEDRDHDGAGDACDDDLDGDHIANAHDVCPTVADHDQLDTDHDGIGDACDGDLDGDGVTNTDDDCPRVPNSDQADADHDGIGDPCQPPDYLRDTDGDGIPDPPQDLSDGTPRLCDFGRTKGCYDNCVSIPNRDQNPAVCDPGADADGDGVRNGDDDCILVPDPRQERTRGQAPFAFGDACDNDQDGDGVLDLDDNCPYVRNPDQKRTRARGPGDACLLPLPPPVR